MTRAGHFTTTPAILSSKAMITTLGHAGEMLYQGLQQTNLITRSSCAALNSTLASLHSQAENRFLLHLLQSEGAEAGDWATFLGAERRGAGGEFRWEDGTAWDFTNWDRDLGKATTYTSLDG